VGPVARSLTLALCGIALPAAACEYPDEGNMPLRRAVAAVKALPETDAWHLALRLDRKSVQYVLYPHETLHFRGRCFWTLDAFGEWQLWQRFYVSPDGRRLLVEGAAGRPVTLSEWRSPAD
jgi:hypothetical protein